MSRKRSKHAHGSGSKQPPPPCASAPLRLCVPTPLPPCAPAPLLRLRWEGAFFNHHSLAHVNRELCGALLRAGAVELSLVPTEATDFDPAAEPRLRALAERVFAPLGRADAVHVRHMFPPRWRAPEEGCFVLMQLWEFGSLPRAWVEQIRRHVHEVWCYSTYVRDLYLAAGCPEEQVHRVPLGVDVGIFHPEAPPHVFTTEPGAQRVAAPEPRRFVFGYVGGTIWRKGIDLLLEAYLRSFSALDPVALVIKDTGTESVHQGQHTRQRILELASDPTRPPIVYLEADLSAHQLAGLYTAADCLVQPYRGEGFCLPALEAMACGVPVIATAGGATDDFLDETVGWRVPAERRGVGDEWKNGRVEEWTSGRLKQEGRGTVDGLECVGEPWVLEPDLEALGGLMRRLVADREEARGRGAAARERAAASWSWEQSAAAVLQRVRAIEPRRHGAGEAEAQGSKGAREQGRKGAGEQGSKGAREQGPEGAGEPEGPRAEGRPLISLCMIVRNEARVLGACLESVQPWVEEMIVADTGSTDETVAIAERFGARVVHFPWRDSFAAARNESMKPARGEWILWVDADDTLPFQSGERIRQAAMSAPDNVAGFVIPVQFVEDGSPAGGTRVDHVKLFRNLPGLTWEGRVHEQILPSLRAASGGEIARLDAVVLHSGYDTSPEGQAKKQERNRKLLLLDLQEDPEHPFRRFNLGMEAHFNGEHEAAVEWLRKSLAVSEPGQTHVRKVHALLALSLRDLGRQEEFLAALDEGLKQFPDDPELRFHAGNAAFGAADYRGAKANFLKCLDADTGAHFSSIDMGILGYKTHHNLGNCCLLLEDYQGAKEWWEKAIEAAAQFLPSVFALFDAAMEARDLATAERMAGHVWEVQAESESWAKMMERLADAGRGAGGALIILDNLVRCYPAAAAPRLVLARRLLVDGRESDAASHLAMLAEQDVAEAAYCLGVMAIRQGDLRRGLRWMERAQTLNPEHQPTQEQVTNLRQALAA